MNNSCKYFAFISYNSKDTEWGKKVQKKLEHYRMPATLCSEHGWDRTPIKPVFFAPTDIQPGGLSEELQERLRVSKNLIVICSPNSAQSEWVGREIEFFHQLGRTKQIHFFIVEGTPHSGNPDTECFNPVVDSLGLPEILGANIHEQTQNYPFTNIPCPWLNKERAYVQLISKLLGVEFDAIWQRHRRLLVQKVVAWLLGVLVVLSIIIGVWFASQPVDVEVRLNEATVHNDSLPPMKDAIVTMTLDNETKTDTVHALDSYVIFKNIPRRFINKEVRVTMACQEFLSVDTTLILKDHLTLDVCRDPKIYGDIHFRLWDPDIEKPVSNLAIEVAGQKVTSDANGNVALFVPLEIQRQSYPVSKQSTEVSDTVFMPCGEDDVILIK